MDTSRCGTFLRRLDVDGCYEYATVAEYARLSNKAWDLCDLERAEAAFALTDGFKGLSRYFTDIQTDYRDPLTALAHKYRLVVDMLDKDQSEDLRELVDDNALCLLYVLGKY